MTWTEVIDSWQNRQDFQVLFSKFLRDSPFQDFFFEMQPVSRYSQKDFCEFVLVNATGSYDNMTADPKSFAKQLGEAKKKGQQFATFWSLRKDSQLTSPRDMTYSKNKCYLNLARFTRNCAAAQVDAMWKILGEQLSIRLASSSLHTPTWVSTSGLAVPWLHMRFDQVPKYYTHKPYKTHNKPAVLERFAIWSDANRDETFNNAPVKKETNQEDITEIFASEDSLTLPDGSRVKCCCRANPNQCTLHYLKKGPAKKNVFFSGAEGCGNLATTGWHSYLKMGYPKCIITSSVADELRTRAKKAWSNSGKDPAKVKTAEL
jgi:hypothetical protein